MSEDIYTYEMTVPNGGFNYEAAQRAIDELTFEEVEESELQYLGAPRFQLLDEDAMVEEVRDFLRQGLECLQELDVKTIGGASFVQAMATEEEMSESITEVDLLEMLDGVKSVREALTTAPEIAPSI